MSESPRHLMSEQSGQSTSLTFSNAFYDGLKYIAQIFLPACGALYFSLASIWHLPKAEEVVGTITVVDTFLGALLLISAKSYENSDAKYDGAVIVHDDEESRKLSMQLNATPEELATKKDISFRVVSK